MKRVTKQLCDTLLHVYCHDLGMTSHWDGASQLFLGLLAEQIPNAKTARDIGEQAGLTIIPVYELATVQWKDLWQLAEHQSKIPELINTLKEHLEPDPIFAEGDALAEEVELLFKRFGLDTNHVGMSGDKDGEHQISIKMTFNQTRDLIQFIKSRIS